MDYLTNGAEVPPQMHEELRRALTIIAGKWKTEILWLLNHRVHRFGELKRAVPGVSQNMLTSQLRELERDGLITRTVYAEVPPRVEYAITETTRKLQPTILSLLQWWEDYGAKASGAARGGDGVHDPC